jgi:glycine/D-amino acid oxidase-like deaminating enzyme
VHHSAQVTAVITDPETNTISGVKILYGLTQTETIIQCKNIIICAGPWTSKVFRSVFPLSTVSVDISSLAGYSLVLRSPRHTVSHERDLYHGHSHAIFTTHPNTAGFSTEIFSREGGEIFIAGLNSSQIPLPDQPEGAGAIMDKKSIEELKAVAIRLLGKLRDGEVESTDEIPNLDDLELVREGLCFRPVPSISGRPVIVTQVMDELLGPSYQSNGSGIGRDKGGVFIAAGHGPWGISLSLGTGKVVADLVDGVEPGADIKGLAL